MSKSDDSLIRSEVEEEQPIGPGAAQQSIERLLKQYVDEGIERGLQVAVYWRGRLVVDAWAGVADRASGEPVTGETLFPVFSVGKGITATVAHRLAERGVVSYDTPIAEVWPEFGCKGKETITLRQILCHTAGVFNMPDGVSWAEIADWETICRAVANLEPGARPGLRANYHAITYGWIVGETLRRADGRPFRQLLEEEICQPLGLDGLFIGLPASLEPRVARIEEYDGDFVPPNAAGPQAIPAWMHPLPTFMNRSDMRRSCLPASSAIANARSLARHYAALLPCGVNGAELLPPDRVRLALERQPVEDPAGQYSTWMLGYHQIPEWELPGDPARVFGHGGYGGAIAFADLDRNLAVGLTKNLFHKGDTRNRILEEIRNFFPKIE